MDAMDVKKNHIANQNRLKKLKDLLTEFEDVTKQINALHNTHFLPNGSNEYSGAKTWLNDGIDIELMESNVNVAHNSPNESYVNSGENNLINDEMMNGTAIIELEAETSDIHCAASCVARREASNVNLSENNLINGPELEVGTSDIHSASSSETHNSLNVSNINLGTNILAYGGSDSAILDLYLGSSDIHSAYSNQYQTKNHVMGIELQNDAPFNEDRLERILNKEESNTNLTNFFYYLFDGADSFAMLDHETERPGMHNEIISQNHSATELEWSDHVTLTVDMLDYNSDLRIVNEIVSPELNEEVELCHSETGVESSDRVTLTVDTIINADVEVDKQQQSSNTNVEPYHINVKPGQGCDKTKMYVPTSNIGRYSKRYCCLYCLKPLAKLGRHLRTVHANEEEVKTFQALPFDSKERRAGIDKLRRMGRFMWNQNAKLNGGELSTSRRPNIKFQRKAMEFEACDKCGEQLRSTGLRRHWNVCTGNPFPGERIVKELSRVVEGRLHVEASKDLHTIFSRLRNNEEVTTIRFDWIVITYANDLCINLWRVYQFRVIRTKLRNAGKVLIASRSICNKITDFASLYHVSNCNTLVEAIRTIAGFDFETKTFKSPGTAATLVTLVIAIGELLSTEYLRQDKDDKEIVVAKFLRVFRRDAKIKINKAVSVTQETIRRGKIVTLPSTDDVGKLTTYLDREREASFTELTECFSKKAWLSLAKLTLMSVLVFNRKRVGDIQNIFVSEFLQREIIAQHKEAIPEETKEIIKSRMQVRGKLYRTVPVLLKHHFDDCLDLLLRYRKDVGVPDNNKFLFGLPSKTGRIIQIDACALFRAYSKSCGAEDPQSLRGTKLRKHFASKCGTLGLSDNQVTTVSKFMGHSEKIHRDVYRQNPLEQEVVEMCNLLEYARGPNKKKITANAKGRMKGKRKREQVATIEKPRKRKKIENISNNEANAAIKKPQKRKKQVAAIKEPQKRQIIGNISNNEANDAIKKPQKRKKVNNGSNKEPKVVKRTLASKLRG